MKDRDTALSDDNGTRLERRAVERESRVHEIACWHSGILSRAGPEKPCLRRHHPPRLNTTERPIANQYREGKVKRTPDRGVQ